MSNIPCWFYWRNIPRKKTNQNTNPGSFISFLWKHTFTHYTITECLGRCKVHKQVAPQYVYMFAICPLSFQCDSVIKKKKQHNKPSSKDPKTKLSLYFHLAFSFSAETDDSWENCFSYVDFYPLYATQLGNKSTLAPPVCPTQEGLLTTFSTRNQDTLINCLSPPRVHSC